MATKSNGHLRNRILRLKQLYKRDKDKIVLAAKDAKEKFNDMEESVEKYAKANPWKTIGISVLAGMVVTKILGLRK